MHDSCVAYLKDMTPPKSILWKGTDMPRPIQRVKFTKAIARHSKIRDQNPSDGLPVLELWDLIVSVLGNVSRVSDRSAKPESDERKHHKSQNKIVVMKDIDSVPSNVQSARREASLCVFEDNETAINTIIKGRSPTMTHASQNSQSCS